MVQSFLLWCMTITLVDGHLPPPWVGGGIRVAEQPLGWQHQAEQEIQLNTAENTKHGGKTPRSITFTIDGRPFTVRDPKQTAAGLLQLAGLDPGGYDLGELHGNNPVPKRYDDDRVIRVQNGDRFVSIRERAAVA